MPVGGADIREEEDVIAAGIGVGHLVGEERLEEADAGRLLYRVGSARGKAVGSTWSAQRRLQRICPAIPLNLSFGKAESSRWRIAPPPPKHTGHTGRRPWSLP